MAAATTTGPKPPTSLVGVPDNNALYGSYLADWLETVPDLMWPQSVYTYAKMRHDPQIKGVLLAYMMPIMRATWAIDPAGCRDEVVQRTGDALGLPVKDTDDEPGPARTQGVIWKRHLKEAFLNRIFGFMPFERRYAYNDSTRLFDLAELSPRMPWTVQSINKGRDGTIQSVEQTTQRTPIPGRNLVWYVTDLEGANWQGISAIRACFGPWLLKQEMWRVHGTSIRRFGMGVPYVEAPAGASAAQVAQAAALASSMRAGETSGMGIPAGFTPKLMGLTGSVPDALAFIKYLDGAISAQGLAGLMDLGKTDTGSRALGTSFLDLFLLCLQAVADELADVATVGWPGLPGIAQDFVAVNWGPDEPTPRVVSTDVGEANQATAEALNLLMAWGAVTPDPELEAWVRTMYKLPQRQEGAEQVLRQGNAPPAAPEPGTPALPAPKPGAPAKPAAARRRRTVRAATVGHRKLTKVEAAAGFDPEAVKADLDTVLSMLLRQWPAMIYPGQRQQIVDEVAAAAEDGHIIKLAELVVDTDAAASVVSDQMRNLADMAAAQMIREAAHQGVTIDPAKVKIDDGRLGEIAAGRAQLAGRYMAQQASKKAMQVAPGLDAGRVGDEVASLLDALSTRPLADQLTGALMAAQNAARFAAAKAAPAKAQSRMEWQAIELIDENTCLPCENIDETVFASAEDAMSSYPGGGYALCEGMDRCRGTIMAVWDGA